jgi:competence transcription factor ComK
MLKNKTDEEITNEDMIKFFQQFNQKAIIWFPDHILKSYIEWKRNLIKFSNNEGVSLRTIILHQEEFMNQIRKDIGHSNKILILGDITSLYINDFETLS